MLQPLTARTQIGPAQLASIALRTAGQPGPWLGQVRFDPARRWYCRLVLADRYEVWLLTWLPGQQTGLHDHGRSAGAARYPRRAPGVRPGRPSDLTRHSAERLSVHQGEVTL